MKNKVSKNQILNIKEKKKKERKKEKEKSNTGKETKRKIHFPRKELLYQGSLFQYKIQVRFRWTISVYEVILKKPDTFTRMNHKADDEV